MWKTSIIQLFLKGFTLVRPLGAEQGVLESLRNANTRKGRIIGVLWMERAQPFLTLIVSPTL